MRTFRFASGVKGGVPIQMGCGHSIDYKQLVMNLGGFKYL